MFGKIGIKLGHVLKFGGTYSQKAHSSAYMGCKGSWVRIPPARPTLPCKINELTQIHPHSGAPRDFTRFTVFYRHLPAYLGQIWDKLSGIRAHFSCGAGA